MDNDDLYLEFDAMYWRIKYEALLLTPNQVFSCLLYSLITKA